MRSFARDLIGFGILQAGLVAAMTALGVRGMDTDYVAAARDKMDLLRTTPSPRVILVGGSNVAFGFRGDLLEERLGVPVVNLGLHANVDFGFAMRVAGREARAGDVVVLCPEYEMFGLTGAEGYVGEYTLQLLLRDPRWAEGLGVPQGKVILDQGVFRVLNTMRRRAGRVVRGRPADRQERPYTRDSFDRHGDVVAHHGMQGPGLGEGGIDASGFSLRAITRVCRQIDGMGARCTGRGARAVLLYPPVPEPVWPRAREGLLALDRAVRERIAVPVLNRPGAMRLAAARYFDTVYHVDREGARLRSEDLAARLTPLLRPGSGSPAPAAGESRRVGGTEEPATTGG